jgi:hypothetical protein
MPQAWWTMAAAHSSSPDRAGMKHRAKIIFLIIQTGSKKQLSLLEEDLKLLIKHEHGCSPRYFCYGKPGKKFRL